MATPLEQPNVQEWPENPDAGWLGKWSAKQEDLPFEISLRIVREFYQKKRAAALAVHPAA